MLPGVVHTNKICSLKVLKDHGLKMVRVYVHVDIVKYEINMRFACETTPNLGKV